LIKAGIDEKYFTSAATAERLPISAKEVFEELLIRLAESKDDTLPRVKIRTSKGDIVVELFEDQAPNTVANFVSLVESKFYDGLKFHRVIEGFMAQGGDPKGDGSGGPDYQIKCECQNPEARRHFVGSLSMAHAGQDTGGSQFFLTFRRTMELDGKHTVFGRVVEGLDVLDKITRNYDAATNTPLPNVEADKIESMEVVRKRDHEYKPIKVGEEPESEAPELHPPSSVGDGGTGDPAEDKKESATSDKSAPAGLQPSGATPIDDSDKNPDGAAGEGGGEDSANDDSGGSNANQDGSGSDVSSELTLAGFRQDMDPA
jgi:cyclophilin family peptidyl-prolyl cis-trans isomerase